MSLFVGNLSRTIKQSELERLFEDFGPCKVRIKGNYGFVDYEQKRDAEEAKSNLTDKEISGSKINLQWSNRSGNGERDSNNKHRKDNKECYYCGSSSHIIRNCPKKKKYDDRSYSRDRNRKRRSRSRSISSSSSRSSSRSRTKSKRKDNDKRKNDRKSDRRSDRKIKSRSRSRSRSPRRKHTNNRRKYSSSSSESNSSSKS
jgi:arginine/serine-rich splicing factor 7